MDGGTHPNGPYNVPIRPARQAHEALAVATLYVGLTIVSLMSRFSSLTSRTGTFLPEEFWPSHQLCFTIHDVMTQLLVSGERAKAFFVRFDLSDKKGT